MREKDKLSYKVAVYGSWVMAVGVPFGIFAWAYFTGQIKQADQLFKWLLIIGVIVGVNVGQFILSKKHDEFSKDNHKRLNSEDSKKARLKWAKVVGPVILFGLFLSISQPNFFSKIEASGLILLYSFLGTYIIYKLCVKFSPKEKNFVSPISYWAVYFFLFAIYLISIPITIAHINATESQESSEIKKSVLFNGHWVGMNQHRRFCYNLKHWEKEEEFGSFSFCTNEYPRVTEGDEVDLVIKQGDLGFFYIDQVTFPRLRNFEAYIDFVGGEEHLRYGDMWPLDKLKGRSFHYDTSKHWIDSCNEKTPYKCRLASYLYSLVKQDQKATELVRKGCDYNEFVSCYGLYLYTRKGTEEKKVIEKKMLDFCKDLSKLPKDSKKTCDWLEKETKPTL